MAMERNLFRQFEPSWWDVVSSRARTKTLVAWQTDAQLLVITIGLFILATMIDFVSGDRKIAVATVLQSFKSGLIWTALFAVWYGVNIVKTIREVYEEQQEKIAELEAALEASARNVSVALTGVSGKGEVGDLTVQVPADGVKLTGLAPNVLIQPSLQDQLILLRVDGVKIRNERIVDTAGFTLWLERVREWEQLSKEVLKKMHGAGLISLADYARFGTLDKGIPVSKWAHALNQEHNNQLRYLSRRIDILLEIMATL